MGWKRAVLLGTLIAGCSGDTAKETDVPVDTGPVGTEPGLTASGPIQCVDATTRDTVPLLAAEYGADWVFAEDYRTPAWDLRWGGRGVVVGDFDGDGHLDLVAPQFHEPTRLLRGRGDGGFDDASSSLPDVAGVRGAIGGSAADYDGDGDLDLFLFGQITTAVLLTNDGTGAFSGQPMPEWDDPDFPGCGGSASWADFDLDGDLDLYYGRLGLVRSVDAAPPAYWSCPSRLLENQGDGTFVNLPDQLDARAQEIRVMASGWHQFDDDPYPELLLVADAIMEGGGPETPPIIGSDLLLDNGPGGLTTADAPTLETVLAGMGLAAADVNADGLIDVMVPGVGELAVLDSTDLGLWVDVSVASGLRPVADDGQSVGWGGEYADLDNDGTQDLIVTYGAIPGDLSPQPDEIYLDLTPGEPFTRAGVDWGFDDGMPSRGFIVADFNEDGWPDIAKRELGGVVLVHTSNCGRAAWMQVDLRSNDRNTRAIGATVSLQAGDAIFTRTVTAGSTSFASGGPPTLYFGLGDLEAVDRISVRWPDGTESTFGVQPSRQRVSIQQP